MIIVFMSGCVSKNEYEKVIVENNQLKSEVEELENEIN